MRGISDPAWKKGPTYSKPTDSEHALDVEPAGIDIDGVGVDEAEAVDGTPICATFEAFMCLRDGCDADEQRRHVYTMNDVSDEQRDAVVDQIEWTDDPTDDDVAEWIATSVEVVDYDEAPVLGEDDVGLYIQAEATFTDDAHGPCYGHEEPSPEPHGL